MIVIKDNGTVYFASSMQHENGAVGVRLDCTFEENGSIWHLHDGEGRIVMVDSGVWRTADVLRYSDAFDGELSFRGMARICERVKDILSESGVIVKNGEIGCSFCIARGDRAYKIDRDGSVFEVDEFFCTSNSPTDEAVYLAVREIPDVCERIKVFYQKRAEFSRCVYFPISVINTSDDSYTLIYEK